MKFPFIIFLVALLLFRRIKRSVGFQKYNETSLIIRMVLFSIVSLLFLGFGFLYPMAFINDGVGIIAGLILAYIATNHAQFEKRDNGLYFKTHVWIELAVVCLFLFRFIYRMVIVKDMFQPDQDQQDMQTKMQTMHDPITGGILFTFCAYYIGYFSFILKEGKAEMKKDSNPAQKP
jgi:hypothetical protein